MSYITLLWGYAGPVTIAKQKFERSQKTMLDYVQYAEVCGDVAIAVHHAVVQEQTHILRLPYGHVLARRAVQLANEVVLRYEVEESQCSDTERLWVEETVQKIYDHFGHLRNTRRAQLQSIVHDRADFVHAG